MSKMGVQGHGRFKATSAVYWLRFFLAVGAGFTNYLLRINGESLGDLALYAGIGLGIAFYILSIAIVRYVLRYGEVELKGKNRYITVGGGTFIVVWVMVAVLLNTVW